MRGRGKSALRLVRGDGRTFKLYIDGVLHLHVLVQVAAIQSWVGDGKYCIEYTTAVGEVLTEYTERALWERILKALDESFK